MAAENTANHPVVNQLFILYLLAFVLMIYGERYCKKSTIRSVEYALQKMRMRIVRKICRSELRTIEKTGSISAYHPLLQGVNNVSDAAMVIIDVFKEGLLLIIVVLYIAWLSPITCHKSPCIC